MLEGTAEVGALLFVALPEGEGEDEGAAVVAGGVEVWMVCSAEVVGSAAVVSGSGAAELSAGGGLAQRAWAAGRTSSVFGMLVCVSLLLLLCLCMHA